MPQDPQHQVGDVEQHEEVFPLANVAVPIDQEVEADPGQQREPGFQRAQAARRVSQQPTNLHR